MTIRKCDGCGRTLTDKTDYYTVDEITFNKGDDTKHGVSVYYSDSKKDKMYDLKESFCSYTDLHFCVPCWEKEALSKYLKEG